MRSARPCRPGRVEPDRNVTRLFVSTFVWGCLAATGPVAAGPSLPQQNGVSPLLPTDHVQFESAEEAARLDDQPEVLKRPGVSLADEFSAGQAAVKQSWWPLLYSAIIPGTGELMMGYEKRGIALMALELVAWTGYFYNNEEGLNKRADYESYADAHWDQQRWADWHYDVYPTFTGFTPAQMDSIGREKSGNGAWPGYTPWVSRDEDRQHYYENIGKYDWFISGWADYDPDAAPRNTDLRDTYRSMRKDSNDQLDTANQFIYLSLATRVFSMIETSLLIMKARKQSEEHASLDGGWMFRARPEGTRGGRVYVEYRFK